MHFFWGGPGSFGDPRRVGPRLCFCDPKGRAGRGGEYTSGAAGAQAGSAIEVPSAPLARANWAGGRGLCCGQRADRVRDPSGGGAACACQLCRGPRSSLRSAPRPVPRSKRRRRGLRMPIGTGAAISAAAGAPTGPAIVTPAIAQEVGRGPLPPLLSAQRLGAIQAAPKPFGGLVPAPLPRPFLPNTLFAGNRPCPWLLSALACGKGAARLPSDYGAKRRKSCSPRFRKLSPGALSSGFPSKNPFPGAVLASCPRSKARAFRTAGPLVGGRKARGRLASS